MKHGLIVLTFGVAAAASTAPLNISGMVPGKSEALTATLDGTARYANVGPQQCDFNLVQFEGYCAELDKNNYLPGSYDVTAQNGASLNEGWVGQIYNRYGLSASNSFEGAAVQLAIWDVIYDNGDGLDTGRFTASGYSNDALAQFNLIIGDDYTGVSSTVGYFVPTSHGPNGDLYQAMIGKYEAVPEPASMAALGVGALALLRRRKASIKR